MKKTILSLFAIAAVVFAFTACSDVPTPEGYSTDPNAHGGGSGGGGETATGDGSEAAPFNIAAAIAKCKEVGSTPSTEKYYIKGVAADNYTISESEVSYGNASFDIVDAVGSSDKFKAFQVYGTNGTKLTKDFSLNQGDEVIVYGQIYNYSGKTPETVGKGAAYIVSVNGKPTSGDTPTPPTPTPGGDNLLKNGDFETWADGLPTHWKTTTGAGNATLTQSSDARNGSHSVSVGFDAANNKRMGYEETTLKAGTYTFSFYAKSTTTDPSQTQAGYVDITSDGKTGKYNYGGYVSLKNTEWTLVSTTFTLSADTKVSLLMMSPKTSSYATAQNILVDDATLVTSDGGIVDGGGESGGGESGGGESGGGETGKTGTLAAPLTVAEIYAEVAALPADKESTADYYAKGKVCSVKYTFSAQYGTATFNISDDGSTTGKQFTCYGTYYMGNKSWVEGNTQIKVGDEVVVCGKVINYKGDTPEFNNKKNYLISINGATE